MRILTLNYGSTNLKWALFQEGKGRSQTGRLDLHHPTELPEVVHGVLDELEPRGKLDAVVHRVVHGGRLTATCRIDPAVLREIEAAAAFSPIHNRRALAGIRAVEARGLAQIAVFDTAFHTTIPFHARAYALPGQFYERGLHRYGFHGISFQYLVQAAADYLGCGTDQVNGIFLHLGGGASACAVYEGKSVDTSMGLTPLEGLVMSSRSGDIDPGLVLYLLRQGMNPDDVAVLLTERSGLVGLGDGSSAKDVIERAAQGDERCARAVDVFVYRIRKYVGAYLAALPRCDLLVFSGGIGENSPFIRERVCVGIAHLGIAIDPMLNRRNERDITGRASERRVLVLPTDEEEQMYREALALLRQ